MTKPTPTAWAVFGLPVVMVVVDLVLFAPGLFRREAALHPMAVVLVGYALVGGLALTLRHRYPLAVFAFTVLHAMAAKPVLGSTYIPNFTVLAALATIAAFYGLRWSLPALMVAILTVETGVGPFLARFRDDGTNFLSLMVALSLYAMLCVFAWIIGWYSALRRERLAAQQQAEEQASELSAERMTRAVMDERLRIASELHDIVASSVTVMVLQAAGGAKVIDRDPAKAKEALQHVESTGTEAMEELRRMLGVLRSTDGLGSVLAARQDHGVRDLEAIVATIRRAGVAVTLEHQGSPRLLADAVDVTAARIVQESLTNTLKYAGRGAKATVCLTWQPDELDLRVEDNGAGMAPELTPGMSSGAGLVGLEQRVLDLGGTFRAGLRPEGGFTVEARLPSMAGSAVGQERGSPLSRLSRALTALATFGS